MPDGMRMEIDMRQAHRSRTAAWCAGGSLAAACLTAPVSADFTDWMFDWYTANGVDYMVIDVYAQFDDPLDTVSSVFNAQVSTPTGAAFHHDDFHTLSGQPGAWSVEHSGDIPGVVDASIDSFVLIGGPIGASNTTELDDLFVPGTGGAVPTNAGWFNVEPTNLNGRVDPENLRLLIGRFVLEDFAGGDLLMSFGANLAYDQGPGTELRYAWDGGEGSGPIHEVYIPSPATLPTLLLAAGWSSRGRRRSRS